MQERPMAGHRLLQGQNSLRCHLKNMDIFDTDTQGTRKFCRGTSETPIISYANARLSAKSHIGCLASYSAKLRNRAHDGIHKNPKAQLLGVWTRISSCHGRD